MAWNNATNLPGLNTDIDWAITGLAPNATFNMCLFGSQADYNRSFNMTIEGTTLNVPTFDANTSSPIPGCVLFTNLKSDASGKIEGVGTSIGPSANTGEADWSGFQLVQVPVPEPSTLILLGSGVLTLIGRIRRKMRA